MADKKGVVKNMVAKTINHWGPDKLVGVLAGTGSTALAVLFLLAFFLPNSPMELMEIIENNKEEF